MRTITRGRTRSGAVLLAVGAVVAAIVTVPTAAQAAPAPAPALTFNATLTSPDTPTTPVAAPANDALRIAVRFTNTSSLPFPMGRVAAQLPAGFVLSAPGVDRSGWTAGINGQVLTARQGRSSFFTSVVLPGQSVTVTATVVNSTGVSVPTTFPVPVTATGPFGLISLVRSGPVPTIVALQAGAAAFAARPGVPLENIAAPNAQGDECIPTADNPVCSTADLPKGAQSTIYFSQRLCTEGEFCPTGTEVWLDGDFGTLYGPDSPSRVVLICDVSVCPHRAPGTTGLEDDPSKPYDYNKLDPNAGDEREVVEDYTWYPVYVQLKGQEFFGEVPAPPCAPADDLVTTGKVVTELARSTGYCVDVNAITREGNSFTGDLYRPVLFFEDPKMR